jgi:hypothetical protein
MPISCLILKDIAVGRLDQHPGVWVARENVRRFEKYLNDANDEQERARFMRLLAIEQEKLDQLGAPFPVVFLINEEIF